MDPKEDQLIKSFQSRYLVLSTNLVGSEKDQALKRLESWFFLEYQKLTNLIKPVLPVELESMKMKPVPSVPSNKQDKPNQDKILTEIANELVKMKKSPVLSESVKIKNESLVLSEYEKLIQEQEKFDQELAQKELERKDRERRARQINLEAERFSKREQEKKLKDQRQKQKLERREKRKARLMGTKMIKLKPQFARRSVPFTEPHFGDSVNFVISIRSVNIQKYKYLTCQFKHCCNHPTFYNRRSEKVTHCEFHRVATDNPIGEKDICIYSGCRLLAHFYRSGGLQGRCEKHRTPVDTIERNQP